MHTSHRRYRSPNRSNILHHDTKPSMLFINSPHSCYHSRKLPGWACKLSTSPNVEAQSKVTAKGFAAIRKSSCCLNEQLESRSWEETLLFFLMLKDSTSNWKGKAGSYPKMQRAISSIVICIGSHFFIHSNRVEWGNTGNDTASFHFLCVSSQKRKKWKHYTWRLIFSHC